MTPGRVEARRKLLTRPHQDNECQRDFQGRAFGDERRWYTGQVEK